MNKKALLTLSLSLILLCLCGYTAFAAGIVKLEVTLPAFQWSVNGNKTADKATFFNGKTNVPSSMNYMGTTYLPIRLIAEQLNLSIEWDEKTRTATLVDAVMDDPIAGGEDPSKPIDYIPEAPGINRPVWEQTADAIITKGVMYMGTPYDFGAPLGQTDTFDCSSFVNFVYASQNIKLKRTSRDQSKAGTEVAMDQIRKGDLLFFTTPARKNNSGVQRIGHVAIYLGDNKLLHTYRVGIGVAVTTLDDSWKDRIVTARRVIAAN